MAIYTIIILKSHNNRFNIIFIGISECLDRFYVLFYYEKVI